MYVRFVIHSNDSESGYRQGIFQAMSDLEHEGVLLKHEQSIYDETYQWFRNNLKKPKSLSRSSKPHAKNAALSWFKDSAKEHIEKMRILMSILESHGIAVEMVREQRPGYIVYEDQYQVAAEPFNDTAT